MLRSALGCMTVYESLSVRWCQRARAHNIFVTRQQD